MALMSFYQAGAFSDKPLDSSIEQEVKYKSTVKYRIDTGTGSKAVYEFIPEDNNDMRCVFVSGFKQGGLACYEAKELLIEMKDK